MKPIVILQHGKDSSPGTIGRTLDEGGYDWQVRSLWAGEPLPESPTEVAALIVLGGDMNVYEESDYPFLISEKALLRQALAADLPQLGICLGAQMLAEVAGGHVYERNRDEIGWLPVELTADDPVLEGLASPLLVFEWHSYSFTLPPEGMLLAERADGLQAFRLGRAWGLQFHPEVELSAVAGWISEDVDVLERHQQGLATKLRVQTEEMMPEYTQVGRRLVDKWLTTCGLDRTAG